MKRIVLNISYKVDNTKIIPTISEVIIFIPPFYLNARKLFANLKIVGAEYKIQYYATGNTKHAPVTDDATFKMNYNSKKLKQTSFTPGHDLVGIISGNGKRNINQVINCHW